MKLLSGSEYGENMKKGTKFVGDGDGGDLLW